jgi:hypothetical protein
VASTLCAHVVVVLRGREKQKHARFLDSGPSAVRMPPSCPITLRSATYIALCVPGSAGERLHLYGTCCCVKGANEGLALRSPYANCIHLKMRFGRK